MKTTFALLAIAAASAATILPAPAGAANPVAAPPPEAEPEAQVPIARLYKPERVGRLELGYRGSYVTQPGFNPFSNNDYLGQLSLGYTRALVASRSGLALGAGVLWDHGESAAQARGDTTSLLLNRVSVPIEGRLHLRRWGYGFVRVAPGVAAVRVEVDDASAPGALTKARWLFSTDLSAGYALPVATRAEGEHGVMRFWLQGEGGYGWVAGESLVLSSGAAAASPVDLGTVALRGAFFRVSLAAGY
jgi:hypothetical protein